MDTWYFLFLLYIIEPFLTYSRIKIGTKRYHSYSSTYLTDSKLDRTLPKIVCKHFGVKRSPIHIDIYLRYVLAYIFFIRIFVTTVVGIFTGFNSFVGVVMFIAAVIILFSWAVANMIVLVLFVRRKPEDKPKKKSLKERLKEEIDADKALLRGIRIRTQPRWQQSLRDDLCSFLSYHKRKRYVSVYGVNVFTTELFPKYKRHIYYEICNENRDQRSLVIYEKKTNTIFIEMLIKK